MLMNNVLLVDLLHSVRSSAVIYCSYGKVLRFVFAISQLASCLLHSISVALLDCFKIIDISCMVGESTPLVLPYHTKVVHLLPASCNLSLLYICLS